MIVGLFGIIALGIIAAVPVTLVIMWAGGAFKRESRRTTSICTPSRSDTLTGYTRPRQWYHIRVPVKRRERVDI